MRVTDPGVVVVDKPAGWTSHQVVGRLRRVLGTRKVGHAGTLDPMATGVLVVGVNRATRLLGHLMLTGKRYLGTMRLGATTDTDDADGTVTGHLGAGDLDAAAVARVMRGFVGRIEQVPTAVSAIKVDGKRAYQRVRDGEEVTLAARPVTIDAFDLLATRPGPGGTVDADVDVRCGSGTYIRALARDVGARLGVGGHLVALRRTEVGPFGVEEAVTLAEEPAGSASGEPDSVPVVPIAEVARRCFPVVEVDADAAARVRHGGRLAGLGLAGVTAVFDGEEFLALYRPGEGDLAGVAVPEAVFC